MKKTVTMICAAACLMMATATGTAQDVDKGRVHYTGTTLADPYRHDGGLRPVVGVHNIQLLRAERDSLTARYNHGWTYNHQPMMCYWRGRFYVHYLTDSISEHVPPSRTMMQTSADGYTWTEPQVLFPTYRVPDGFTKAGCTDEAHGLLAIMHQRVGFFISDDDRLLATGNYGIALNPKDDPNDGNGIGRVVREVKADGTLGPIHFLYYNHGFSEKNTDYPYYTRSRDKGFVRACQELMADPLYRMQMVEESDRNDPMLPLKKPYKAFCHYQLDDGRTVGLWKHALTSISTDGGETWAEPVQRARGFVNSNAKIWGQRLTDGTFATLYNPAEFRWPLALSLSSDGLEYSTLNLVHGIVPPIRYGGNYKSFGPQYVRGILPGNGTPPDGDLWACYSVGKEDIWVTHIPVPVRNRVTAHVDDDLGKATCLTYLREWNLYAGIATPVTLETDTASTRWLRLADSDPYSFAQAERMIPDERRLQVSMDILPEQVGHGMLQIDFTDAKGTPCARIEWTDSLMRIKGGARYASLGHYEAGQPIHIEAELSVDDRNYTVRVNGRKKATRMMFAPVESICRIIFRTGAVNAQHPTPDTPADQYTDMEHAGKREPMAAYRISGLQTKGKRECTLLDRQQALDRFQHYSLLYKEETDTVGPWMSGQIPLFDCPDATLQDIYYFRWWTLGKHIKQTPVGMAMTEFLVPRSYADKYNLISSALGHHLHETRWLRDTAIVQQIAHTWYRGNGGQRMERMTRFSSWTPYALWQASLVTGGCDYLLSLLPDMADEYRWWKQHHRLPNGLYSQSDVQDAMEESISGGRGKRYARPTINSYMYGNACALAATYRLAGDAAGEAMWQAKADTLRRLVVQQLWSTQDRFFETLRGDTLAAVREAIGYVPWYFHLPPQGTPYDEAWLQLEDPEGFCAPYGLTTAERRHPQFRAYFKASCEWNGPIWPFATSQTLTALANWLNDSSPEHPLHNRMKENWFQQMLQYARAHHFHGRPYIGEYLDEQTGYWLKGDQQRSRHYNHSTFCDLVITGIVGLRPTEGDTLTLCPLVPEDEWPYFCLDGVRYRGHDLTILWDRTGMRYGQGKGLQILINGHPVAQSDHLGRLQVAIR